MLKDVPGSNTANLKLKEILIFDPKSPAKDLFVDS